MSLAEFAIWNRYASQRPMPTRRLEHYLAQITFAIAKTMGGSQAKSHADFMMDFTPGETIEDATPEEHAELLRALVGGKNPRIYAGK